MIDYYKSVLKNYANFDGRARRSEYWYYTLMNVIIVIALEILLGVGAMASSVLAIIVGLLLIVYAIGTLVPSISVMVRRLHDIGKSGWWYFIALIPLAGPIWLIVLLATDSQEGTNEYGVNPKTGEVDLINTIK